LDQGNFDPHSAHLAALANLKAALAGPGRPFKNVSDLAGELTEVWELIDGKKVQKVTLNSRLGSVFAGRLPISATLEHKLVEATRNRVSQNATLWDEAALAAELGRLVEACRVGWAQLKTRTEQLQSPQERPPQATTTSAPLASRADTWVFCPDVQAVSVLLRPWSSQLAEPARPARLTILVWSRTDAAVAWQQLGLAVARATQTVEPEDVIGRLADLEKDGALRVVVDESAAWPCNVVLQAPLGETPKALVQTVDRDHLAQIPFLGFWRDFCIEFDLGLASEGGRATPFHLEGCATAVAAVIRATMG